MAITATVVSKQLNNDGTVSVVVKYSNGPQSIDRTYTFAGSYDLPAVVAGDTANFNALIVSSSSVIVGQQVASVASAVVDTNALQFTASVATLRRMNNAVALGLKSSTDADVVSLTAAVSSTLSANPSYLNSL